ncbi:unnamed protein product [Psylliodes chrysocephalus]|uniref:Peptidase C1A papain C-terminal domain-containing protein n=1 Tax=Psylliodes chrysocephalus TaxID=3402493 RepID=A0A9P0GJS3_9CUCU|nr:unnamed protein product [Psylliodes chrysocephala]
MRITLCLAFLMSAALAANSKINPLSDEFINHINSQQNDWKAGRNFDKNIPISEIKKRLGGLKSLSKSKSKPTVHSEDIEIPESFDARTHWPECSKVINDIVDQSNCGSCWAVSAASVMSDRRCIASGGSLQVPVSAEDVISCCHTCIIFENGCQGSYPELAFDYWFEKGVVTGGQYNSSLGCKPYALQPCDRPSVVDGKYVQCSTLPEVTEKKCMRSCSTSGLNYKSELTYGKSKRERFATVEDVQREILQNGPVVAYLTVFEDFLSYKSGVYYHVAGKEAGGHVIRIIGWGTENNVAYWIAANSWNDEWGDAGLFKIRRGVNECAIEENIYAAQPKL